MRRVRGLIGVAIAALVIGGIASAQTATPPSLTVCIVRGVYHAARHGACAQGVGPFNLATGSAPVTFTTPGSTQYTVPNGFTQLEVVLIGGGGGGGANFFYAGGGGGSGGMRDAFIPVGAGTVCDLTVGNGGLGGGAGYPPPAGTAGGTTSLQCGSRTATATGGGPGGNGESVAGSSGGAGGTAGSPNGEAGTAGSSVSPCTGSPGGVGGGVGYGQGGNGSNGSCSQTPASGENGSGGEIVITPLA